MGMTLEEALEKILILEEENQKLRKEVEELKNRNLGGRKKHDETWQATFQDFVDKYSQGLSMKEITADSEYSRRTAYRYLAYYKALTEGKEALEEMLDKDKFNRKINKDEKQNNNNP